jgi:hypothetical protein
MRQIATPIPKTSWKANGLGTTSGTYAGRPPPAGTRTTRVNVARIEATTTGPMLAPRSWNISLSPIRTPESPRCSESAITFVNETRIAISPTKVGTASTISSR